MLKSLHVVLIFSSLASYVVRILLLQFKPQALHNKFSRIAPHVINTLLIISGVALILLGGWLDRDFGWIISKFILLLAYIALGVMSMHNTGLKRWAMFAGAMACFVTIFVIAITKNGFI